MEMGMDAFENYYERHLNRREAMGHFPPLSPELPHLNRHGEELAQNQRLRAEYNQLLKLMQANVQLARPQTEPTKFYVLPDLAKTVSSFNSEKRPSAARQWIHQIQTSAVLLH